MACTIQATAGHVSANSYATIAEGDTYFQSHLYYTNWENVGDDEKCRALQTATRMLDYWFEWQGVAASSSQALLWPRDGVMGRNGYELASDTIPTEIKEATFELALMLLGSNQEADSPTETQGLKSLTAGPVSMTFASAIAKPIPDAVMVRASWFGTVRSRSGGSVRMYRA